MGKRRRTKRKTMSVTVPEELWNWYWRHALLMDVSLSKLVYGALEYYRIQRSLMREPERAGRPPFYGVDADKELKEWVRFDDRE